MHSRCNDVPDVSDKARNPSGGSGIGVGVTHCATLLPCLDGLFAQGGLFCQKSSSTTRLVQLFDDALEIARSSKCL